MPESSINIAEIKRTAKKQQECGGMKLKIKQNIERVYMTADSHFSHENIIKYCDRPFDSVEEMDRTLIDNWNAVVPEDGVVIHAGDFAFCILLPLLSNLMGLLFL
tara:strand:+ start:6571 stop:6885 length:315 start_codon:yes stop_codon:yes gene_type:complete